MHKLNQFERIILTVLYNKTISCGAPEIRLSFREVSGLMSHKSFVKYCKTLEDSGYIYVERFNNQPHKFELKFTNIIKDVLY